MKGLLLIFVWAMLLSGIAVAEPNGVEVLGHARFTVITPQLIRIEYAPDGRFVDAPSWFAANRAARFTDYEIQRHAASVTIDTGVIRLSYQDDDKPFDESNLHAEIKKEKGTVTWQPGLSSTGNLGGANRTLDQISEAVPISDGVISRDGWYLLDDSKSVLATQDWFEERSNNGATDWYLFGYGLDYKAALKSLTTVSGPVPLPRKYTMGIWYSRYWPYSADDFRKIVAEYHDHGFPLDDIVMDMDWHTDGWTGYTWNPKLIPDGPGLLAWFHRQGLAVTLNDHPADGVQAKESMYVPFMNAMGADASGGKALPFDAGDKKYLDTFWNYTHVPFLKEGVDFWWLDWQQFPKTKSLPDVTNLAMLNDYYFKQSQADGKRGQSFSRWAGWGDQRNPIHFSGDADTGWPMLAFEVPFTSTSGNAGCFFWTHDIGGHRGGRNEESYTRWCQFGSLSAALRSHSMRKAEMDRRPWTYPDWAEKSMQISFQLRARLLPYIYTVAAESAGTSVPFLRPMYIDHPEQEAAYHNGQQYYLGDNLLVAPITMPGLGPNRVGWQHVWFPEGTWFQYFTGEKYNGPDDVIAAADINEFPLFVRGGVPLPEQPYTERPTTAALTHLVLRCFPGPDGKTGTSSLYEDDGVSRDYMNNGFANTSLSYSRAGQQITVRIAPAAGTYRGQPGKRSYTILLPATQPGKLVSPSDVQLTYDATTATNKIEVPEKEITAETVVTVEAQEIDPALIHKQEIDRRRGPLIAQGQVAAPLDLREALQSVDGRGLMAVNQHPYLLGHDTQLVYFNADSNPPAKGTLKYGTWSGEVTLTSGHPLDLSGLAQALPAAGVIADGTERRALLWLGKNGPVLSFDITSLAQSLGDLALAATPATSKGRATELNDGTIGNSPAVHNPPKQNSSDLHPYWAQLTWDKPIKATRVLLYSQSDSADPAAGKLTFSDGTTVDVGALSNDRKTPLDLSFPEKEISWVRYEVTPTTAEAGLSEFAVFDR